jgi:hypothetical protein
MYPYVGDSNAQKAVHSNARDLYDAVDSILRHLGYVGVQDRVANPRLVRYTKASPW